MTDHRPLLAHVLFRFAIGGLENGVVNLINHLPTDRYRHVIICITDHDPLFASRLQHPDVQIINLNKRRGLDLPVWWRLYQLLKVLQPDLVHTRNLPTMEGLVPAWLAGVPARLHSEHGRDMPDLDGSNKRYQLLRRMVLPLAQTVVALSQDLAGYLREQVGLRADKIRVICNGVDCDRFTPVSAGQRDTPLRLISVGRLQEVKDPLNVLRAFAALRELRPQVPMSLELVGDGPLLPACREFVASAGLGEQVSLPGAASDIDKRLRQADLFVLGSQAEGISNTVLEAMASGLPVVATNVGGNAELIVDGETGYLVPASQPEALTAALRRYVDDRSLLGRHGAAARSRAVSEFSLDGMMARYQSLYDQLLTEHPKGS